MIPLLKVTLSQTSMGVGQYMQIISADQQTVNIVLIAERIEVLDVRESKPKSPGGTGGGKRK